MESKLKKVFLYSLAVIGIIFIILILLVLLVPTDDISIIIDKWNEIIEVNNEIENSLTGFGATLSIEPPLVEGEDFNSLKGDMKAFTSHWGNSVKASKTYLEQANDKLDEESDLITEFSSLVVQLSNSDAKRYGENTANNLRDYNSKAKICVSGLSTSLDSMTIAIDNFGINYNTKLDIYQIKIDAGTFRETDYINFLNELTNLITQFSTKIDTIMTQMPSECDEADAHLEKAEDGIKQLEAIQ